jgi:hypothetical protein
MALFNECMQSCAHIVLDTADIVREGDVYDRYPRVGAYWETSLAGRIGSGLPTTPSRIAASAAERT